MKLLKALFLLAHFLPINRRRWVVLADLNRYRCCQYRQQLAAAKAKAVPVVVQTAAPVATVTVSRFWQGGSQRKSSLPCSSRASRGRGE